MNKKRFIFLITILLIISFTVGCNNSSTENNENLTSYNWQINLESYELTKWIDSEISGYGFEADSGYNWLIINLEMTNLTKENNNINWVASSFKFISPTDNIHSQSLAYNDPPGYIDTDFKPEQTKKGFIAFEVPENININEGKLKWLPDNGKTVTFELTDLKEVTN